MNAEIRKSKIDKGLWLFIGDNNETAWAIKENEVIPIMKACQKWLDESDYLNKDD